jgi:hypothetical protein
MLVITGFPHRTVGATAAAVGSYVLQRIAVGIAPIVVLSWVRIDGQRSADDSTTFAKLSGRQPPDCTTLGRGACLPGWAVVE